MTGDTFFERYVSVFYARLTKALKSCASSRSYLSAGTPEEIDAAFTELADKVRTVSPIITN